MKNIILIFVALEAELPNFDVHKYDSTHSEVILIYTGVGKINALQAINDAYTKLNRAVPFELHVINAGTCGSTFHPLLKVLKPNTYTQGDAFQKAPFKSKNYTFGACQDSMSRAIVCATSDRFMDSSNKDFQEFELPIDCFEMEAYSYANFIANHPAYFYSIKVVSDNCDGTIKDWWAILNQTALILAEEVTSLVSTILNKSNPNE